MPPSLEAPLTTSKTGIPPFPLRQTITTPTSSHGRGDWGLKRNLPLRTKVKTISYDQLDNMEHFTTFESAERETQFVRKWQEMDVALVQRGEFSTLAVMKCTAFDEGDNGETARHSAAGEIRWRYKGPWLKTMSRSQLREYIKNDIVPRRDEFYRFVKKRKAERTGAPYDENAPISPTDEDILELRSDLLQLQSAVIAFLDLPQAGEPLKLHPSAGLYYTLSNTQMVNDPEVGPQTPPRPAPARFVNSTKVAGNTPSLAAVGGVIATVTDARLQAKSWDRFIPTEAFPETATVAADGRIIMEVRTTPQASSSATYGMGIQKLKQDGTDWRSITSAPLTRGEMEKQNKTTEDILSLLDFPDRAGR